VGAAEYSGEGGLSLFRSYSSDEVKVTCGAFDAQIEISDVSWYDVSTPLEASRGV
jgi:hypothetical protein